MAAPHCSVCSHPKLLDINAALFEPGRSVSRLSVQYGVGIDALYDHRKRCIAELVRKNDELQNMLSAVSLLMNIRVWHGRLEEQYAKADAEGNRTAAIAAARAGIQANGELSRIGIQVDLEQRLQNLEEAKELDQMEERERHSA